MNKLKEMFSTTMNQYHRDMYIQLLDIAIRQRTHPPKFVKDERTGHYHAEPLNGFYGDCEDCIHYSASPFNFVEGGDCLIDGQGCGYGCTCPNHRFKEGALYEVQWLEEQLKKKDGDPL